MLRTRENSDVFNSLDEIYLVFTSRKQIFSMYIIEQSLTSDVSLAVYNKLNVSVDFIRKSRTNFIDVRVSAINQ